MRREVFIFSFLIVLSGSCRNETDHQRAAVKPGSREMTELNRYLVQKDREIIQNYIERKSLKMTESSAGLWYLIKKEGSGQFLKDDDRISIKYECRLIDGTLCYSSDDTGPRQIVIGKTDIEPGLNEGLRLLKQGGQAVFILPPFLAFGLVGDGKKIPPRSIVVYDVSIVSEERME